MFNSGWIVNSPYSPIEVLQSLVRNSANHTPLYFLLLNLWGHLVGNAVAMGRTLTIFTGLLSLAITYRLARDFVAPIAGLIAIILLASNAFYNYFYAHARMYPLLMLASATVIWLYLRIIGQQKTARRKDYLLLGASCYLLANTHAFSALLFITLGAYHLLFVAKDKRWLWVSMAVVLALLLFSPWAIVLVTKGIDRSFENWSPGQASLAEILWSWLVVNFNGAPVLAVLSATGLWIGIRDKTVAMRTHLLLPLFLAVLGLVAQITNSLSTNNMRLAMSAVPLVTLFSAAGLYAIYRKRRLLGLLPILWILAGIHFQQNTEWRPHLAGRTTNFQVPAWQAVSRIARQSGQRPVIYGYHFRRKRLYARTNVDYSQYEHYFGTLDIKVSFNYQLKELATNARKNAVTEWSVWIIYSANRVSAGRAAELRTVMEELNYSYCGSAKASYSTVILQFKWSSLDCGLPAAIASSQTDLVAYEIHGLSVDLDEQKLYFIDRWASRNDFAVENYKISHQLINDDWEMVAQLDVPLVHEEKLRRFWIDVSEVPPGNYRLMAILYNAQSDERVKWIDNPGYVPEMLSLGEIKLD